MTPNLTAPRVIIVAGLFLLGFGCDEPAPIPSTDTLQLWHEVDIEPYAGSYLSLGDLDNDGRVDLLLHRIGPHTTPGYLVALSFDGELLWEVGDSSLEEHMIPEPTVEPPCRGIAFAYDIDEDDRTEVVAELWQDEGPFLVIIDGETGDIEDSVPSPFDLDVRLPPGTSPWRGHPVGRIARLQGEDQPPSIILKYGSSNRIPGHVVALSHDLETLWHVETPPSGVGHIPTVADIDGDGRDEVIAGEAAIDDNGELLWTQPFGAHADMTAVADVHPADGVEVLMSICRTGPAYCLSPEGDILWEISRDIVSHGQGLWVGDFIHDIEGVEVIVLRSGHSGEFVTVRGHNGEVIEYFAHQVGPIRGYPDLPVVVNWTGTSQQLWIPIDRALVDGRGEVVQSLDLFDEYVVERLRPATEKETLATQAIALDLCGDERDELILYQPYSGDAVLIFTQSGSGCSEKPYVHHRRAYNIRTYF